MDPIVNMNSTIEKHLSKMAMDIIQGKEVERTEVTVTLSLPVAIVLAAGEVAKQMNMDADETLSLMVTDYIESAIGSMIEKKKTPQAITSGPFSDLEKNMSSFQDKFAQLQQLFEKLNASVNDGNIGEVKEHPQEPSVPARKPRRKSKRK